MSLQAMLERAQIWRAQGAPPPLHGAVATGFPELDERLSGGWPRGALTEVLAAEGAGALSLLVPALATLAAEGRWLALVAPPHRPYAPAFAASGIDPACLLGVAPRTGADTLWALEQCLRSGACAAVLGWLPAPPLAHLRRLQLAAEAGDTLACLFYPPTAAGAAAPTPASLRLAVRGAGPGPIVQILKRRGGTPGGPLRLMHADAGSRSCRTPAHGKPAAAAS